VWVPGRLSRRAPALQALPAVEVVKGSIVRLRARITEIASSGPWAAALVEGSRTDCAHAIGWRAGRRSVVRFTAQRPCDADEPDESFSALALSGTSVTWSSFYCGNFCYSHGYSADVTRRGSQTVGGGDEPVSQEPGGGNPKPRPAPPRESRRGVAISVTSGTILLRRVADGLVRTIRPPGGAVDAELETAGLFYAYNVGGTRFPGHLAFVPFDDLFSS
jgi:hypothetical protein